MPDTIQKNCLVIFAFLTPSLAFFAPLAMALVFVILALYPAYLFFKNGKFKNVLSSDVNKVILVFLAYSLLSAFWAIKPSDTINLWIRMVLLFIGYLALFSYVRDVNEKEKILKSLLIGIVVAIIIANIEILTNGIIIRNLRFYTDEYLSKSHIVRPPLKDYVVELNRGSSMLSILSWAVICWLFIKGQYKAAVLFFCVVLATLARLESLSTVMGFVAGGFVAFPLVYFKGKNVLRIFAVLTVVGVFSVAAGTAMMDANKIVGSVPVVPGAASNIRIYIYDYAAKQAMKKPVFGWGFNSSRHYPVKESEYVDGGRSPLPLHPHNNTLQVWLELGAVGLVVFATFLSLVLLRIKNSEYKPHVMATSTALFTNYFVMGQTGYGIWQNWWVAGGILAASFLMLSVSLQNERNT